MLQLSAVVAGRASRARHTLGAALAARPLAPGGSGLAFRSAGAPPLRRGFADKSDDAKGGSGLLAKFFAKCVAGRPPGWGLRVSARRAVAAPRPPPDDASHAV